MSCHNIGRAMNSIMKDVLEMYDRKELSKESTIKICCKLRDGVWHCDGNEGEALEYISACRCGKCLKVFSKGDLMLNLWEIEDYKIFRSIENNTISPTLCESCFRKVLKDKADESIDYIKENWNEKHYIKGD